MKSAKALSACQRVRSSKPFAVFIVWATFVVSYMFYGALVPLLPLYMESFNGAKSKTLTKQNTTNTGGNITQNSTTGECHHTAHLQSAAVSQTIGAVVGLCKWTQLLSSPFIGPFIDKIGYDIPFFMGYIISIGVSIGYIFVNDEASLFIVRAIQGVGDAFLSTAGLTIVSHIYKDDDATRGTMIGYAMSGISIGLACGPPLGSIAYQLGSKLAPFLTIAVLMTCVALLQLFIRPPRIQGLQDSSSVVAQSPWKAQIRLLKDPYVIICLILTVLGLIGVGFIEATLPLHMVVTMCPQNWMLGVVFVPMYLGTMIGTPILGWLSRKYGRFIVAFFSYVISAGAFLAFAFCKNFVETIFPGFPLGLSEAANNSAILPIMIYLVDNRIGQSAYGSAYALANIAMALAFAAGPILGGLLEPAVGFAGLMYITAGLSLSALIPLAFLRKPLADSTSIIKDTPGSSSERNNEESSLLSAD